MMTSRELVMATLDNKNPGRVPRQLWVLPWAQQRQALELEAIHRDYPDDIVTVPDSHMQYATPPRRIGDWYKSGTYIDEWNCEFISVQSGLIGEVKHPRIPADDDDWTHAGEIHFPVELLTLDKAKVNEYCRSTECFVLSGELLRPFERMQFIRGTEAMFIDIACRNQAMLDFLERVHEFYISLLHVWASTEIDGIFFMDDWGSQQSLLVDPRFWVEFIKPKYKEYCDLAHSYGKKIFFHSDGNTYDIIPHLIDIGVDAANLQIFCIGIDKLSQFQGKINFWGEIDRQHILSNGSLEEVKDAVTKVRTTLWKNGGAIAQCELGAAGKPENIREVFASWMAV